MFCPKCKKKFKWMLLTCPDCGVPLEASLIQEVAKPSKEAEREIKYINYVPLYSPQNESELVLLKSILDSEGINYFVRNDNFGSLEVGPRIGLFNAKMIEVQDDQSEQANELLSDYFEKTKKEPEESAKEYSWFDKIRMVIEVLVFGWLMPGRWKQKKIDD
jgi:hypothetical protein